MFNSIIQDTGPGRLHMGVVPRCTNLSLRVFGSWHSPPSVHLNNVHHANYQFSPEHGQTPHRTS